MVAISVMPGPAVPNAKSENTESNFSNFLSNLKISLTGGTTGNSANGDTITAQKNSQTFFSSLENKSKFKTIKIFVASNKNEFKLETECLLQEAQPELQQYFMQHGYDLHFIDVNLNYDFDPIIDPFLFEAMKREVDDCMKLSEVLSGNKYGQTPLPLEINQAEYDIIKSTASNYNLDIGLLNTWYNYDENNLSPCYRLKPVTDTFPNIYNKYTENVDTYYNEHLFLKEVHHKLIEMFKLSFSDASKTQLFKDCFRSANEILTNLALKTPGECLLITRLVDGINAENKNADKYLDIESGRADKEKESKQKQFIDSCLSKVHEENSHQFRVPWREKCGDIFELLFKETESSTDSTNSSGYGKFDDEFRHYLQSFNAIVVGKIKALIEKRLQEEDQLKTNEAQIYQETTRHLNKFQQLTELNLFNLDEFNERAKRLVSVGIKNDHYPIFIYGSSLSGKTVTLGKFGTVAYKLLEPNNCMLLVRFCDLTSQCSSFEGLLYSICEQLCILQKLNPVNELKNKDVAQLVDCFYSTAQLISKNNRKQLLILIDGLQDINVEKSLLAKSNVSNNQISWLFAQQLPPRVHMIVSVKRHANNARSENDLSCKFVQKNTASASNNVLFMANSVPLFLSYFNEKVSSEAENYLFELPLLIKKSDLNELAAFVKNDLARNERVLTEQQLQIVLQAVLNLNTSSNSSCLQSASSITTNSNIGAEINSQLVYLNFILKDVVNKNVCLSSVFREDSFPRDPEAFVKYKLDSIERVFNQRFLACIFNYITAAHNGITEMELLDLLSCNNEFFSEFYSNTELPAILRFPISHWLLVKHNLRFLLKKKYMDNKVTYYWCNDLVKKIMKQRYLNKVDQIRTCHKDMANYFLESFVETKPLVDMNKNMQIRDEEGKRYISQQPLLYSETKYNFRRLNELWFHLMNSGDIQRLKENAFFNFEHLLAKCHGMSVHSLLNDIDAVLRRILDSDMLLLNSLLRKSILTLLQEPLRLASEILARLRPLQEEYGEHVKSLVQQTVAWCDQHESPTLVPLTTWLESAENLLITRIDHPDGIGKLAVTSFNQHVFFSNLRHEICMYHIPSKKLVRKFCGHMDTINCLQISYNNRFLISGSSDKSIRVWNLGTGEIENTFNFHKSAILCSVLTHSDEYLITGTQDRTINIIKIETGDVIQSVEKHFDAVTALAISVDDCILVSASLDKTVKRWLVDGLILIDNIVTVYSPVTNMVITCDNTFIIIGCENKTVQVKSLITGADIHDLSGHNSTITSLAASSDCERIYVACTDSKLYLYNILSRELIAVLIEQESSINDLKISADNSFLFSSSGNSLFVLNLKKKNFLSKQTSELLDSFKAIKSFAISKEGDMAITGDESGQVCMWNILTGELMEVIIEASQSNERKSAATKIVMSNFHLFCVIAFANNLVDVYDIEMGDVVTVFAEHQLPVQHMFIFDDNRRVLSSDGTNHCKIWLANSGQLLETITVLCPMLSMSPDTKYAVSGKGDHIVKIWGYSDAKVIRSIDHPERISIIAFTHDALHVITGGDDNSCKIWELPTGKLIQVLIEHDAPITSIATPVNNTIVVSGSKDKSVILWNFKDSAVLHKFTAHQDVIIKVAITNDGNMVISGSRDSVVNVWSSYYGILLTSINLQYTLSDFLITNDATRMVFKFEDSPYLPILRLSHKPPKDPNRTISLSSLKSFENFKDIVKIDRFNKVLPIKTKPLLFNKQSSNLVKLFSTNTINFDEDGKDKKHHEKNTNEAVSTSQNSSRGNFLRKSKRKAKKSSDFSSTASIINNDTKQKKTKICCLI